MTCIVGLVDQANIWIGGDSAVTRGRQVFTVKTPKVFKNGEMLLGVAGNARLGQIARYSFKPPTANFKDAELYLATDWLEALRKCYEAAGFLRKNQNLDEMDGEMLIGYRGRIFSLSTNLALTEVERPYHAIGSGSEHAHGAFYATEGLPAEERVRIALEAAAAFSGYVRPPWMIEQLEMPAKLNGYKKEVPGELVPVTTNHP